MGQGAWRSELMPKGSSPASGGGERPGLRDTGVSAAKGGWWPGPRLNRYSPSRRPEASSGAAWEQASDAGPPPPWEEEGACQVPLTPESSAYLCSRSFRRQRPCQEGSRRQRLRVSERKMGYPTPH